MKTFMFRNKNVKCVSIGRNGSITTCGLGIYVWDRHLDREWHTVNLTVLRKNGAQGRCIIEFPVSEIPEIVKKLQECYDEN